MTELLSQKYSGKTHTAGVLQRMAKINPKPSEGVDKDGNVLIA